jgi:hypothetical protein
MLGKFVHFFYTLDNGIGQIRNVFFVRKRCPLAHKAFLALAKKIEIGFLGHRLFCKLSIDGRFEDVQDLHIVRRIEQNATLVHLGFQVGQAQN